MFPRTLCPTFSLLPQYFKNATPSFLFTDGDHFRKEEVSDAVDGVLKRYKRLPEAAQSRRSNLQEASAFYQFCRDVDDELAWIAERQSLARSDEFGESVSEVQTFIKRHQKLRQEVLARDQVRERIGTTKQNNLKNRKNRTA